MFKSISAVLIWSENYKKLSDWYREKFGFEVIEELGYANDTGIGLRVGIFYLWIGNHSEVHGNNKDPYRMMFNISVDSVKESYTELVGKGVEFIAQPFLAPTNKWFATFQDIDGNIGQLIGAE
ncbi:MAG: hypothetical protein UX61_C0025G0006 [Parcubacteria group bacterium GW2011_GWA2_46_7]|nr:MAG: hypothetical protein UX15_C0039G0008 [Parcubacteria group bacterium GW2011_GWA1_45_7]KKU10162.1 MAG: hypothetical protein UX14_C0024G0009 [Parcubacteria group bacterium GW2011_GWF1_45_5]KKU43279.1 MAG: hypothetical protein UX61_C0025G0006 [Parcubacteria group bacterium GW2011_GWA2_46_7]OHD12228.1 MAG: hypothetical protein A2Z96_03725 [Spirochaetes bacterium GWB1_48_6]